MSRFTFRLLPLTALLAALLASFVLAAGAGAAVLERGPYLQQPTPNSIIVRWRTDVATDSRVEWGKNAGSPNKSKDDATLTTEHEIEIDGLKDYTTYFYRVGSTTQVLAGGGTAHAFRTPPKTGDWKATRIWAIGDSGFPEPEVIIPGVWEKNGDAVRDAFIAFNGAATADIWLLLGDNAYPLATDAEYQAALFEQYPGFIRTVAPWPTFGNHEAFSANGLLETGPYFDNFTVPTAGEVGGVPSGTEAYYSFDHGNIHFVVLESEDNNFDPVAQQVMKDWLEADLGATDADWLIAFWHHPPYSKGFLHDSDVEQREILMREDFLPMLEDFGVDLVLNGHSHSYERSFLIDGHYDFSPTFGPQHLVDGGSGDPGVDGPYQKLLAGQDPHSGTVYVVAGSASEKRISVGDHPAMAVALLELGSLVLDVNGHTATGTFLSDTGAVLDHFVIEKAIESRSKKKKKKKVKKVKRAKKKTKKAKKS